MTKPETTTYYSVVKRDPREYKGLPIHPLTRERWLRGLAEQTVKRVIARKQNANKAKSKEGESTS